MESKLNLRILPSSPCELDFAWYELIRDELLRRSVPEGLRVLDVGCGTGEVLCMLSAQIGHGVGIDISEECVSKAKSRASEIGIANLQFKRAGVLDLPLSSVGFDVVMCLGDVLSSSTVYGKQGQALGEMRRVLAEDGLTIYEGMNWEWEYAGSPLWTCFSRTGKGRFVLHRIRRTPSGRETERTYDVAPDSPLHEWMLDQDWPVSPSGHQVSLDVVEEEPISQRWLRYRGLNRYQFYTARSLKRLYSKAGFHHVEVYAYGQTYDIVSKAGLLEGMTDGQRAALATAEANLVLKQRTGSGPWLFLLARK